MIRPARQFVERLTARIMPIFNMLIIVIFQAKDSFFTPVFDVTSVTLDNRRHALNVTGSHRHWLHRPLFGDELSPSISPTLGHHPNSMARSTFRRATRHSPAEMPSRIEVLPSETQK